MPPSGTCWWTRRTRGRAWARRWWSRWCGRCCGATSTTSRCLQTPRFEAVVAAHALVIPDCTSRCQRQSVANLIIHAPKYRLVVQVVDFYKGLGFEADPDGIKCAAATQRLFLACLHAVAAGPICHLIFAASPVLHDFRVSVCRGMFWYVPLLLDCQALPAADLRVQLMGGWCTTLSDDFCVTGTHDGDVMRQGRRVRWSMLRGKIGSPDEYITLWAPIPRQIDWSAGKTLGC